MSEPNESPQPPAPAGTPADARAAAASSDVAAPASGATAPGPAAPEAPSPGASVAGMVDAPPGDSRRSRTRRVPTVTRAMLAGVLVLALVAALAVWLDGRRAQQALRKEVAQRLAEIETATQATGRMQTQLAGELRDAQAKITLLETRIAEWQSQQAALEALYRDLAPSRDEIALTEIEQVLVVASQQLMLAGNVQSALSALQLADARLQRLERPQFLPLRRALTRDIDRLKAMPFVDIAGISLKLDQLQAAVPSLPFAMDERLPPPAVGTAAAGAESAWRTLLRDAWVEIRQLVRVEVADRPAAPLLAPTQQYFIRENLKLRLLSARIALVNRDDSTFKADLAAADNWLKVYFDTRAKPVQAVQATLKQLAATPMGGSVPDLTGSLEALRVLRLAQERAPARGAERAPAPAARPPR